MDESNREQIEFWNKLGRRWSTYQESLDLVWQPIGDAAVERAAVRPGEHVIDVGCGCGATTLDLAVKVGLSGSVIGIDVSTPMLARARDRALTLEVTNLEFVQADASTHAFADEADLLFSRMGVMFFPKPVAAFANLRRALRPGGRLVFVCFRERQLNSLWTVPFTAAATVIAPDPPTPANEPGPFSLSNEVRIRTVLDDAGFVEVVCEPVDHDLVIGGDVYTATEFLVNAGPAARFVAGASNDVRSQVQAAIRKALERHVSPTGVTLRAATWIVQAKNPLTPG